MRQFGDAVVLVLLLQVFGEIEEAGGAVDVWREGRLGWEWWLLVLFGCRVGCRFSNVLDKRAVLMERWSC
jgi:hypothetical protein